MSSTTVAGEEHARLFWGCTMDMQTAVALAMEVERVRCVVPSARIHWQPETNWHLTLCFLGDVPSSLGSRMAAALAPVVAALPPFSVELGPACWFPSRERPVVIAATVAQERAPLRALVSVVEEAAVMAGQPRETRPWRGHVTLARVPRGYRPRDPLPAGALAAPLRVDHVALFRSVATPQGRRYEVVLRLPLAG